MSHNPRIRPTEVYQKLLHPPSLTHVGPSHRRDGRIHRSESWPITAVFPGGQFLREPFVLLITFEGVGIAILPPLKRVTRRVINVAATLTRCRPWKTLRNRVRCTESNAFHSFSFDSLNFVQTVLSFVLNGGGDNLNKKLTFLKLNRINLLI